MVALPRLFANIAGIVVALTLRKKKKKKHAYTHIQHSRANRMKDEVYRKRYYVLADFKLYNMHGIREANEIESRERVINNMTRALSKMNASTYSI